MKYLAHYGHRVVTTPWDTPPGRAAEMFARAGMQIERIGLYLQYTAELYDDKDTLP